MKTPRPHLEARFRLLAAVFLSILLILVLPVFSVAAPQDANSDSQETTEIVVEEEASEESSEEGEPVADGGTSGEDGAEQEASEDVEPVEIRFDGKVVLGKIDGEISLAESAYVKRLVEAATLSEAEVLVIELNTFGGRVDAAVAIRDSLLDASMHTVVFINKRAISAGALISFAAHEIAISQGGTIGAAAPIVSGGSEMPQPVEEKYLSYFREEMRITAETRGRNGDIAEAMVDNSKVVEGISEEGKLLTLNTNSAIEHGMVDVEAKTLEDAFAAFGIDGEIEQIEYSWAETLVAFLTSQAIASILLMGMLVLGYMEFQTPGFGAFGFGAAVCFLLLYFSHYLVNLAGWEELLIFGLGVLLLMIELFVTPGFGIFGVLGATAIVSSTILLLMAGDWSDFSFENPFSQEAVMQVLISNLLAIGVIMLLVRFFPMNPNSVMGRRLTLAHPLATDEGFTSHEEPDATLVGLIGTVTAPLRPSGKVRIDGKRYNVETEGDWVPKGGKVRVLRHDPGRILVRPLSDAAETSASENHSEKEEEDA